MTGPRTTREALIAEMLGDLDGLITRIEALPTLITDAQSKLSSTAAALDTAGDQYRMAVTAFTEQAKTDLNEYFDMKAAQAAQVAAKMAEEQHLALQQAACNAMQAACKEFHYPRWSLLLPHVITILLTSICTASLIYVTM